jgi:hemolysin activation/secretion protein
MNDAGLRWPQATLLLLCLIAGVLPNIALSAAPDPLILEQSREQQKQLDEEAARRLEARPTPVPRQPQVAREVILLPEGECQAIHKIWLYGADVLTENDRERLLAPFLGQCLDNRQINALARQIQTWYLEQGYITSRVQIKQPQDSLDRGNLELWVYEGRIGSIRIGNDTAFDRRRVRAAFPTGPNEILNIHELDQGLEQLNRLVTQQFHMQIRPSERPGYSDIILSETAATDLMLSPQEPGLHRGRQKLAYNYNNGGAEATGRDLQQLEFTRDNLLGFNDSLAFAMQRNVSYDPDSRANETLRLDASMPWGYWFFRAGYNQGRTTRTIPGTNIAFLSRNRIQTSRLSVSRVLQRAKSFKTEISGNLEYSQRKSFINDTLIEVSSRDIAAFALGMVHTRYFPQATLVAAPTLVRGVPWFGAIGDPANQATDAPRAEYTLAKLYAYYRYQFLPRQRFGFSYQGALTAQVSDSPLYGEKQIVVGGEYSVRGFRDEVVAGDEGWYLRNDLILNAGRWFDNATLNPLQMRLFLDAGSARNKNDGTHYTLAGWGIGAEYRYRWFNAYINVARPWHTSDNFDVNDRQVVYAGLTAQVVF